MAETEKETQSRMGRCLGMNHYGEKRYRAVADYFKDKSGTLLDVGCCEGGLRGYLNSGLRYTGADGMPNEFPGFVKVDLNGKKLPFEDKTFDAINCSAVLEHLLFPLEMLREMKRVLKEDGVILVSLPNDKSLNALYSQLFVKIPDYDIAVYEHHWRFSIQSARDFFEKEFRIIREEPEFGPLFRKYLPFLKLKFLCTEWFMLGVKK